MRLTLHIVQTVFAVAVVKVFRRVAAVGDRPVAPRAPSTHQVLRHRLVPAVCDVGRVVKLGHVHVRAHTVRVLRTIYFSTPKTCAKRLLHRGRTVTVVGDTNKNSRRGH